MNCLIIFSKKHTNPTQEASIVTMSRNAMNVCRSFSLCATFLLNLQAASAQYNFTDLDNLLVQMTGQKKSRLGNKTATVIWKGEKIIYQKETGDFKATTRAPIASASKWLTAALAMVMVEQGKISLDDPVSNYLPIFRKYAKGYITIRHCLSNTTGLESEKNKFLEKIKFHSLEEEVNYFASNKEINQNPGVEFRYGTIGLSIAGRVIEVVGKKSFDRLMQEKLLRPLGMKNTTFANETMVDPSAGAVSTANDYIKFLAMLLNNGMINGKRILSEESIKEMETSQITPAMIKSTPKLTEGFTYGLGEWITETDRNGNSVVITSPGLYGTWPFIDNCRKYACIVLTQDFLKEDSKETYLQIKDAIDTQLTATCAESNVNSNK